MQDDHVTIFSTAEFVDSWCRAFSGCEPLAIEVEGSGPPRTMHLVKTSMRYGLWNISGPKADDLWASPGWTGELSQMTVKQILHQLRVMRTKWLRWQVRFDHEPLAIILSSLGLAHKRVQIHVLRLDKGYGDLFEHYHATTRNHVRKAARRGVVVRDTCDMEDVLAYQAIYSQHAQNKDWGFVYPAQLTMELAKMTEKACLKVAQYNGEIVGGALFVRDGNSVYYLHGVADRDYSNLFPASAVLDAGIQWACENGAKFFNLGNSGISPINQALAKFKYSWGAKIEQNWLFDWENPLWKCAAQLKARVSSPKPKAVGEFQRANGAAF